MEKPEGKLTGKKVKPVPECPIFVSKGTEPVPCGLNNVAVFPIVDEEGSAGPVLDDTCENPFGVYGTEAGSVPEAN
jgi:hypothetical protein